MGQFSFDRGREKGPPRRAAERQRAASARKGQRNPAPPELTGDPATDQALLELAEVLAEIARDVVRRTAEEHESQPMEGKQDDRRS